MIAYYDLAYLLLQEDDDVLVDEIMDNLAQTPHFDFGKLQAAVSQQSDINVGVAQQRLEELERRLHYQPVAAQLSHWVRYRSDDLLEGLNIMATYQYPDLDKLAVRTNLLNLKYAATHNIVPTCTTTPAISKLSDNLYRLFEYRIASASDLDNDVRLFFLNDVLKRRYTSPTLMAALYYLCAADLRMPIWFIDTDDACTLAFGQRAGIYRPSRTNRRPAVPKDPKMEFFLNIDTGQIDGADTFWRKIARHHSPDKANGFRVPVFYPQVMGRLLHELGNVYQREAQQQYHSRGATAQTFAQRRYTELTNLARIVSK